MIFAEIAATANPTTDYTPAAIGLAGTLIGAGIGFAFNSFSHTEQKRRHINEKVVELLRHTDAVRSAFVVVLDDNRRYAANNTRAGIDRRKAAIGPSLDIAQSETDQARIAFDYIRLTADPTTTWMAREVTNCGKVLLVSIRRYAEDGRLVRRLYLQNYAAARNALISHLSPAPPAPYGPRLLTKRFSLWARRNRTDSPDMEIDPETEDVAEKSTPQDDSAALVANLTGKPADPAGPTS
ncbi:hypothetical protein ACIPWF_00880 [Paenarthrobacter sp. NPDC089989]|uniref:hypothetical protein n=1 Tax=unclassified Paenarthrobacter TaxID=2634190 RepID=UPI0038120D32